MSWREFAVQMVQALAWPLSLAVVLIALRKVLGDLLRTRLENIELGPGGFKLTLRERRLEEREQEVLEKAVEVAAQVDKVASVVVRAGAEATGTAHPAHVEVTPNQGLEQAAEWARSQRDFYLGEYLRTRDRADRALGALARELGEQRDPTADLADELLRFGMTSAARADLLRNIDEDLSSLAAIVKATEVLNDAIDGIDTRINTLVVRKAWADLHPGPAAIDIRKRSVPEFLRRSHRD